MIEIVKVSSAKINGFSIHMFYFSYIKKAFIPYFIVIKTQGFNKRNLRFILIMLYSFVHLCFSNSSI